MRKTFYAKHRAAEKARVTKWRAENIEQVRTTDAARKRRAWHAARKTEVTT
jgi:hypothetical protein